MLRLIGVMFIAVLAQFVVHGLQIVFNGLGEASVDSWQKTLDAQVRKEFPIE